MTGECGCEGCNVSVSSEKAGGWGTLGGRMAWTSEPSYWSVAANRKRLSCGQRGNDVRGFGPGCRTAPSSVASCYSVKFRALSWVCLCSSPGGATSKSNSRLS